jgi:hypothetical protein
MYAWCHLCCLLGTCQLLWICVNVLKFLFLVVECCLVEGECGCFEGFQLLLLTLGFQACKQRGFCDMSY